MVSPPEVSVIAQGTQLRGEVRGADELVLEGSLEGAIHLQNHLTVEPGAQVQAQVEVRSAAIHGEVAGDVVAEDFVSVHQGARIQGTLKAARVVMEHGAHFVGRLEMDVPLPADL